MNAVKYPKLEEKESKNISKKMETQLSKEQTTAYNELKNGIYAALETYSNVHRGSGHFSQTTTHVFEQARNIVLEHLQLNKKEYMVIFCSPRNAEIFTSQIEPRNYHMLSSCDLGLSIGVIALAVKQNTKLSNIKFHVGGGTARLVSRDWVIWSKNHEKFEAGTPAIINIITLAKALTIIKKYGDNILKELNNTQTISQIILSDDEYSELTGRSLLNELRTSLIGNKINVPTFSGEKTFVNLDNAASTPTFKPIFNAYFQASLSQNKINHSLVQEVKDITASFLGASPEDYDIYFTNNTTEAINLVAENIAQNNEDVFETLIVNTMLEHNSNELPWRNEKVKPIRISFDENGLINIVELEKVLNEYNTACLHGKKRIKLVSINGASNVLGIYNDLSQIAEIVHRHNALLMVDAAQLVAHRKIEMDKSDIDFLAFSAHKMYAPFGSGALIARKMHIKFNEKQKEAINKSSEENMGGIAAMGKAFDLLKRIGMEVIADEEKNLTTSALIRMQQNQDIKIFGIKDPESEHFDKKGGVIPFTVKSNMPDKTARKLAEIGGIGVRYGCHCSHILVKRLHGIPPYLERFQALVVRAINGLELPGVVRVSFGIQNTLSDIDKLIDALQTITEKSSESGLNPYGNKLLSKNEIKTEIKYFINQRLNKVYN